MATNNASLDPLQTLSAALAVPAGSPEQAALLASLRETLEQQQHRVPILCTTLITAISNAGDSLLKRWVLDLLHFALARSSLPLETRTQLASQCLDILTGLLDDPSPETVKVVVQCFATMYPLLFRSYCSNRSLPQSWETLSRAKTQILELVTNSHVLTGVKLAALKFMQRVILVQTRGVSDPRLQNKADPNLALCPSDHPFISSSQLEAEGMKLLERSITILFSSRSADVLTAVVNSWSSLAKLRPPLVTVIVTALAQWSPRQLDGLSAVSVKSVEKSIRILLSHISRTPNGMPHIHQIQSTLQKQAERMELAAQEERMRKEAAALEASRKRSLPQSIEAEQGDAKRVKVEHTQVPDSLSELLLNFDFSSLPVNLVANIIIANLQLLTDQSLRNAIEVFRNANPPEGPSGTSALISAATQPIPVSDSDVIAVPIKEEPVDPLQMDMDEDDIEYEPDRLNDQLIGNENAALPEQSEDTPFALINFQLPPPRPLSEADRHTAILSAITRIRAAGEEFGLSPEPTGPKAFIGLPPQEMWILLLVRMVTRATPIQEQNENEDPDDTLKKEQEAEQKMKEDQEMRETLCDYILDDFPSRVRIAGVWMNEEWYNDRLRLRYNRNWQPQYELWLQRIVAAHQERLNAKDKAFTQFLLDLPAIPDGILSLLREFCTDPDKTQVGFLTLREFVVMRPPLRQDAMNILLELTTHPSKAIRTPAINTVKRWVPDTSPMDEMVQTYSLRLLRLLQKRASTEEENKPDTMHEDGLEDGQLPQEESLQSMYLPEQVTLPADKSQVLQHVELIFALSIRVPDLLDEIFLAYTQMDVTVQEAIQDLITALIKSMGPSHPKILALLGTFPTGADTLALRILTIFTENGRPSPTIVALVKSLISERDLDARFLIPIIAEMDKSDILRHLPRIVSMLDGQQEPKNLVRLVFESIVTTPPQTFGSVTSNLPRVRQSELLTPAELMVLLHHSEKEIGLNSAKEAISICFSMTEVFRSEILGVVMQQIMDEPAIPLLFMRTVILSVQTYKTLVGFVATTLLSRLITKKIWTIPALWNGFIHCAKAIAPASFGALLQLPKEQLREIVDKQPGLKSGLRDYVLKKSGNKARVASFLEVFGETSTNAQPIDVTPSPA